MFSGFVSSLVLHVLHLDRLVYCSAKTIIDRNNLSLLPIHPDAFVIHQVIPDVWHSRLGVPPLSVAPPPSGYGSYAAETQPQRVSKRGADVGEVAGDVQS